MLFLGHELDYEIDTPLVPCTRLILFHLRKIPIFASANLARVCGLQLRSQTLTVSWDAARVMHSNLARLSKPYQGIALDFDGHSLSMSFRGSSKALTARQSCF
jgi:hypothetical protein